MGKYLSGHQPNDLTASFCSYYIYSGSELSLAFAKVWSGTIAEYAIGGVEEDIGICGEIRDCYVTTVNGYGPSGTAFITSTDVRTHTADGQ